MESTSSIGVIPGCRAPIPLIGKQRVWAVSCRERAVEMQTAAGPKFIGHDCVIATENENRVIYYKRPSCCDNVKYVDIDR